MGHEKSVWFFDEGTAPPSSAFPHKGVNLAALAGRRVCVPPGFALEFRPTEIVDKGGVAEAVLDAASAALASLEHRIGRHFADPHNPLIVSVRAADDSGVYRHPPAILNLGFNDAVADGLIELTHSPVFVYDCYRRFLAGFARSAIDIPVTCYARILALIAPSPRRLDADELREQCDEIRRIVREQSGREIPQDPESQFEMALGALAMSSRIEAHAAAIVQMMVFGNRGPDCGVGIAWSRNPATAQFDNGGVYLPEAQGSDLIYWLQPTLRLAQVEEQNRHLAHQLSAIRATFERFVGTDFLFDFTVECGKVYVLDWRVADPSAARFVYRGADAACTSSNSVAAV